MIPEQNPKHRHSVRLRDYDYASAGLYFVTICIQGRACLLGEVSEGETRLSPAGETVLAWWNSIDGKYAGVCTDEVFVVMPNHIHGIICIEDPDGSGGHISEGGRVGPPLPRVIQWFKTMTTNAYIRGVKELGWAAFDGRLWQRNYYEHVIRNEKDLQRVHEYILQNALRWEFDKEYPGV